MLKFVLNCTVKTFYCTMLFRTMWIREVVLNTLSSQVGLNQSVRYIDPIRIDSYFVSLIASAMPTQRYALRVLILFCIQKTATHCMSNAFLAERQGLSGSISRYAILIRFALTHTSSRSSHQLCPPSATRSGFSSCSASRKPPLTA